MREAALFAAIFVALTGAAQASVETAGREPASLRASGDWRLSAVGGKIACRLTLTMTRQTSLTGFEVRAPLACRKAFPPLKTVAGWALDEKGGIVLTDAKAQPIVTFPAQNRGASQVTAPDGRTWRLEQVRPNRASTDEAPFVTAPPFGW
jgi:hypothetical protein